MKDNFEMSMIGEMKFFLGLQVHQLPRRIFIYQSQYTMDLLKNHGMEKCDDISTPMATTKLDADLQVTQDDQNKYHSMIGGHMYLTASQPDIAFATFICACYQARPTEKHLKEMQTLQGVMMIAKAHLEAFNFWETSLSIGRQKSKIVQQCQLRKLRRVQFPSLATEPNSPVLNENVDEFVQEDVADFDGNVFYNAHLTPVFKEAKSSSTYQDPSNMREFYQKHRSSDKWTKNHPIEQVIGDPSKPVMTRNQLQTDAEVCMYALIVSTIELKNIKEAMLDAS
ncbi:hypothetical protein Tco_1406327 [Tanacetum coccineum]